MKTLRSVKALVVVFALVALFVGAFASFPTQEANAAWGCGMWVMYCTVTPPIYCWCVYVPMPCP